MGGVREFVLMETRYLETLVRVAEEGSFSKAANILYVTQSAVSQRIKFLEDHLERKLFDRSGSLLQLTDAGKVVFKSAQDILTKEKEMMAALSRFDGKKHLSLCCTPTFGTAYLPKVLNDFILRHSDTGDLKFIFLQPAQALAKLRNDEFDIAVIEHCGEFDTTDLDVYQLPQDELIFISSPDCQLSSSPIELEDLLQYRLYARKDGCSSKNLLAKNLAVVGKELVDFKNVVVSDDLRFTIEAVVAGSGISFISRSLVASHLERGLLKAHHVRGFTHNRCRSAIIRRSRSDDALLLSLLNSLFDSFEMKEGSVVCASR